MGNGLSGVATCSVDIAKVSLPDRNSARTAKKLKSRLASLDSLISTVGSNSPVASSMSLLILTLATLTGYRLSSGTLASWLILSASAK